MKFGDTPLDEAEGAILAHSLRLDTKTLKKGTVLAEGDLAVLREAGYDSVVAARLDPEDVGEDVAADRLGQSVAGEGITVSRAFTGRVNLYAEQAGVVTYDAARLDAFNLVDENVTLALVPPAQAVESGQMIGTLKIISFAVPGDILTITEAVSGRHQGPMVHLHPFRAIKVGLVQTTLPGTKTSVLDSTLDVTRARLHPMNSEICHEVRCEHRADAIAKAIESCLKCAAEVVLISGASAVVDRRDVVPAGIEAAGGTIEHFGMPVDPGNLMLVGRIADAPVVGLPGCARSPKLNGFDWVLQRLIAGLPAGGRELMRMGAGGLLKDIPSRPMPRSRGKADRKPDHAAARKPRIAALVLAAGQSRRMGARNKLLEEIDGVAMVRRVVDQVTASSAAPCIVVLGHESDQVRAALSGTGVDFTVNADFAAGLSTSLAAGIAALPEECEGAIVVLGDMPRIDPEVIDRLIAAFDPVEGRAIVVPTRRGKRGNPVLFAKRFFDEMADVSGDVGARHLIGQYEELVVEIECEDDGVLLDVDTPEALAGIRGAGIREAAT